MNIQKGINQLLGITALGSKAIESSVKGRLSDAQTKQSTALELADKQVGAFHDTKGGIIKDLQENPELASQVPNDLKGQLKTPFLKSELDINKAKYDIKDEATPKGIIGIKKATKATEARTSSLYESADTMLESNLKLDEAYSNFRKEAMAKLQSKRNFHNLRDSLGRFRKKGDNE